MSSRLSEVWHLPAIAFLAGLSVTASGQAQLDCWELSSIEPSIHLSVSGKHRPVPSGTLTYRLTQGDQAQWLQYKNRNDPGGQYVAARATWSAPPQRFCRNDRFVVSAKIENLAPTKKRGNVFASVSWGPSSNYGSHRTGRITLMTHQGHRSGQAETRMSRGQASMQGPATLYADINIGHLYARIDYRYVKSAPATAEPPAALTSETLDRMEHSAVAEIFPEVFKRIRARAERPLPEAAMSDQQQSLLDDFGPPHSFNRVALPDGAGGLTVYDTWAYPDGRIAYVFIDGLLLRTATLNPPAGRIEATHWRPNQFNMGADRQQVRRALGGKPWKRLQAMEKFIAKHAGPAEMWATDGALLGFQNGVLVFVEARALLREGDG